MILPMKKKPRTKSLNLSKLGKAIVDMAVSTKDAVKDVVLGKPKKARAKAKSAPKATKPLAKKKPAPSKMASVVKVKKKK